MMSFFFSSRRRHTRFDCDWSSDVCSSDLEVVPPAQIEHVGGPHHPLGDALDLGRLRQHSLDQLGELGQRPHHFPALQNGERPQSPHRSEEHTSELQSQSNLVCRLLLEKKKNKSTNHHTP